MWKLDLTRSSAGHCCTHLASFAPDAETFFGYAPRIIVRKYMLPSAIPIAGVFLGEPQDVCKCRRKTIDSRRYYELMLKRGQQFLDSWRRAHNTHTATGKRLLYDIRQALGWIGGSQNEHIGSAEQVENLVVTNVAMKSHKGLQLQTLYQPLKGPARRAITNDLQIARQLRLSHLVEGAYHDFNTFLWNQARYHSDKPALLDGCTVGNLPKVYATRQHSDARRWNAT
ncbi:MAG: hypothetical protein R3E72_02345 [Steroidobacteraceae bacterium]